MRNESFAFQMAEDEELSLGLWDAGVDGREQLHDRGVRWRKIQAPPPLFSRPSSSFPSLPLRRRPLASHTPPSPYKLQLKMALMALPLRS